MTDHTPEPWIDDEMPEMPWRNGYIMLRRTDWQRAKACVNACAGIPTEQLQPGMMGDMKTTLRDAAKWFREYERGHAAKGTEAGDDKAKRNGDRAEHCEAALAPFLRKD